MKRNKDVVSLIDMMTNHALMAAIKKQCFCIKYIDFEHMDESVEC